MGSVSLHRDEHGCDCAAAEAASILQEVAVASRWRHGALGAEAKKGCSR